MSKSCERCAHSWVYNNPSYDARICRRFPPSIGNGESPFDEFAPAKFPAVYDNWFCGEWTEIVGEDATTKRSQ